MIEKNKATHMGFPDFQNKESTKTIDEIIKEVGELVPRSKNKIFLFGH